MYYNILTFSVFNIIWFMQKMDYGVHCEGKYHIYPTCSQECQNAKFFYSEWVKIQCLYVFFLFLFFLQMATIADLLSNACLFHNSCFPQVSLECPYGVNLLSQVKDTGKGGVILEL